MIRRDKYSPERDPFIREQAAARVTPVAAPAFAALAEAAKPTRPLRVVIVGAGLAGLCAAFELEKLGHEAVILEADAGHVGGRARTLRFGDGLYGEAGAMRIPKFHEITRHYVGLFNLSLRKFVQSNEDAYYFVRGKRVRLKEEEKLKPLFKLTPAERELTPGGMWDAAVVKLLRGLIEPERDDLFTAELDTTNARALDQRSLQQLLEAAGLSEEAIEFLGSAWGLETSLPSGATEHLREELKAVWSSDFDEIVGGTDLLPRAFAERLTSKPRNGCEVFRIEQDAGAGRVAAVYREGGAEKREEGDFLLCTLPLPVLSRIEVSPALSGPKSQAMRLVNYDSSTKVLGISRRRFWEQDDGIYGGGSSTDLPTGFTYYPSDNHAARDPAVSAARAVFLASYTWAQPARRLAALSQHDASALVRRTLSRLHPQLAEDDPIEKTVMWSWDNHVWSSGAFAWFLPGQHSALARDISAPEGRIHFAGEHTSLTHTWMQGALESAQRAVAEIVHAAGA